MTDIAKEETSLENVRFSRLTVMFPGSSWVSCESDRSGWLTLGLLSMGQYFIQLSASDSTVIHFGFPCQTALQWSHSRGEVGTSRIIYC